MRDKRDLRPTIDGINDSLNKTIQEIFQNITLRPIIKLQHDLLVAYFKNYLIAKRINFDSMSLEKKTEVIHGVFKKDNAYKSELKGMIIGHFELDEYENYKDYKSDYNKRILTMVEQRLVSVVNEL